jgi:cell division protein FtsW
VTSSAAWRGRLRASRVELPAGRMKKAQLEWHVLLLVTLALVAFGLVMVYSATSAPAALGNGDPTWYLERQAAYALIGLVLLVVAARTNYRVWRGLAPGLVVVALGLCVAVLVLGPPINGARRWLTVGPAVFQPSEFAKLALAVWAAGYLSRRPAPETLGELAKPLGFLAVLFCGLILLEPDLGTAICIVVMLASLLLVAGTPVRVLGTALALASFAGLAAIWMEPYRRARVLSFLNPWDDAQGAGFQAVQALIGIGSGGIFGKGLGEGVQKINFLPEAHTDMIFAIVGEELGLIGSTLVIGAYAAFAYAGLQVALRCKDPFGKRLAAALTALVCGQAVVNLAAVLGLAPLTGIPLPFVSAGGSSLVVALTGVGILLNIASGGGRAVAAVPDRGRRDGGTRAARARGGRGARGARGGGDVRRVAGSRRGAAGS